MNIMKVHFPFDLTFFFFLLCVGISCNNPDDSLVSSSDGVVREKDSTEEQLVQLPGKKPMRLLTDRPPNFETPLKYFLHDLTPNDVFFVRWHLSGIPTAIDEDTFRLKIGGAVRRKLSLSLTDLKTKFSSTSVVALCVCSGNARSCFKPEVPGAQWVNGGMGNARWKGVRLNDVLKMAGVRQGKGSVSFNGLDAPPLTSVPDFIKSLTLTHAMEGEVIIAYEMNGEPLPLLNGYPLKLVVPGWFATYWVGMLNEIHVYEDTFKGYWMDKAYLIPKGSLNGQERPDSMATSLVPINKINIRSIFVSPEPGSILKKGRRNEIQGVAFDSGEGITKVEISTDHGKTWVNTHLDRSLGKYSWRRWRYWFIPPSTGRFEFLVRATNRRGDTQPWSQWNRSGYMKNEIESLLVNVQ